MNAEFVKAHIDILQYIGADTELRRVASTNGGEWAGPCPLPGCTCDHDGFRVQPFHERGLWYCRGCGGNRWHDVIDYVMRRDGVDFIKAVDRLTSQDKASNSQRERTPDSRQTDRQRWREASYEFWKASIQHLWADEGGDARTYLHDRGLQEETLRRWMIGYNPTEGYGKPEAWGFNPDEKVWIPKGILIPCMDAAGLHYLKIRRRTGDPKYFILKGGENWPFGLQTYQNKYDAFLFEGEFDVLLAYQTGFSGVGFGSIPANQELKGEHAPFFTMLERVIVAMDNDKAGKMAAEKLCRIPQFIKARPFPEGKDLGEYYARSGQRLDLVFEYLYEQIGVRDGFDKES